MNLASDRSDRKDKSNVRGGVIMPEFADLAASPGVKVASLQVLLRQLSFFLSRVAAFFLSFCTEDVSFCVYFVVWGGGAAQEWKKRTLLGHERVDPYILVLAGSESSFTKITEYIYFILIPFL